MESDALQNDAARVVVAPAGDEGVRVTPFVERSLAVS